MKKKNPLKTILISVASLIVVVVLAIVIVNAIQNNTIKTINIEAAYRELMVGSVDNRETTIPVSVYPETASSQGLVAVSSDNEVATVAYENGSLTVNAVSEGQVTVTLYNPSKTSIHDTCIINVKDIAIEEIIFVTSLEDDAEELTTVSAQKDGFEHEIYFKTIPANGNLQRLSASFDADVLDNAYINTDKQCLTIVPKSKIEQMSTYVDVDIMQDLADGPARVDHERIQIELIPQESFVRLGFSTSKERFSYRSNESFIYLEETKTGGNPASYVYIAPQLGFDKDFTKTADFNLYDYNVYVDGDLALQYNNSTKVYEYFDGGGEKKFTLDRESSQAFKVETTEHFAETDRYLLTFEYVYTGAKTTVEVVYLSTGSEVHGTASSYLSLSNKQQDYNQGSISALSFNFDKGVERDLLNISLKDSGSTHVVNEDGSVSYFDGDNEILQIYWLHNRMYARYLNVGSVTVGFSANYKYWDSRYLSGFSDGVSMEVTFNVTRHIDLESTDQTTMILNGELFGVKTFDFEDVKKSIQVWNGSSYESFAGGATITITNSSNSPKYVISTTGATAGEYRIRFYIDSDGDNMWDNNEKYFILTLTVN